MVQRFDAVNQRLDRLFLTLAAGLIAMIATVSPRPSSPTSPPPASGTIRCRMWRTPQDGTRG